MNIEEALITLSSVKTKSQQEIEIETQKMSKAIESLFDKYFDDNISSESKESIWKAILQITDLLKIEMDRIQNAIQFLDFLEGKK